jgi:hypothetical protein
MKLCLGLVVAASGCSLSIVGPPTHRPKLTAPNCEQSTTPIVFDVTTASIFTAITVLVKLSAKFDERAVGSFAAVSAIFWGTAAIGSSNVRRCAREKRAFQREVDEASRLPRQAPEPGRAVPPPTLPASSPAPATLSPMSEPPSAPDDR